MRIIFHLRKQLLFLLLLPASSVWSQSSQSDSLPVKHVILYKHGLGFFEREGTARAGEGTRLDFKATDMNDVLKSLTVQDASGNRISGIRYDSNETLQQRLAKFPFALGNDQLLSSFLDNFKGARIELKSADRTTAGTIVGARVIQMRSDASPGIVREQLTLLLDSGELTTVDLGAIASMRFSDARLQSQLKQYLETINDLRSHDRRSIYVDTPGSGTRHLRIAYVTPAAIWKSSYRLSLGGNADCTLEGWAIVDNTTDEDWNDVRLSVVSGRPISFISQLDTPRYGRREIAELPEDRAAGPVVYGGSVDTSSGIVGGTGDSGPVRVGGVLGGVLGAPPPDANVRQFVANQLTAPKVIPKTINKIEGPSPSTAQTVTVESSTVEGATGSTLGELFEYNFPGPITIKRSQSAMLPFLQDRITARKLLIYTESGSEHPVNAAEITNNTGKTLDGGPLTVYDGAYAGEALIETLKAGDKRLVGYAIDYGTRVTTAFDSPRQTIREIHAKDGIFQLRYADHQTRTYTIRNVDAKPKTLVIQQEGINQYAILSPKPSERTATAYRFEVALPANGSQALKVEQEHVYDNTTEVLSSTPDFLLSLVSNKQLTATGRKQLETLLALKRQLAQVEADLKAAAAEMKDRNDDSSRLRQNITSLNRVNGQEEQVRQYSSQLAGNEVQIVKLRDTQRNLTQRQSSLEAEVRNAVDTLIF